MDEKSLNNLQSPEAKVEMDDILERLRKIVSAYNPQKAASRPKAMRMLLAAIVGCLKYINDNSQTDRGCAQRMARSIDEIFAALPEFSAFVGNSDDANARHTRRLAEEHLEKIRDELKRIVKEDDVQKKQQIREWVKQHPVFSQLKQAIASPLPKNAYVLLFRRLQDQSLQLITRKANDSLIISRFRPKEFSDDIHVHKVFRNKPPVVGAAVISERELLHAFGELPPATEKKEQVHVLLSLSKEAVGKPAHDYVEGNVVLKALHDLARGRKVPKDAYILLFREAGGESDLVACAEASKELGATAVNDQAAPPVEELGQIPATGFEHSPAGEGAGNGEESFESSGSPDEPVESNHESDETAHELDETAHESDEIAHESDEFAHESDDAALDADSLSGSDGRLREASCESVSNPVASADESRAESKAATVSTSANLEIVVRKSSDGKVITRFWPADFALRHKLFESMRGRPAIVGAAVIKRSELISCFGVMPTPASGERQLDVLLRMSRRAVEQPAIDFVDSNEVLKGLHDLANSDSRHRDAQVILFTQNEGGKLELFSIESAHARSNVRVPLADFQFARMVHERYSNRPRIAGASVIADEKPFSDSKSADANRGKSVDANRGKGDATKRHAPPPSARPVVIAAFGKTPLKVSLLATPENFRRMGLDIS